VYMCIQLLATGLWFSPVSSANKTDRHDTTEILLKMALNTINQTIIHIYTQSPWRLKRYKFVYCDFIYIRLIPIFMVFGTPRHERVSNSEL
jgi:hypothetical protein